jgi:hypothetical protein
MVATRGSVLHQQALTVSGLFTGLTLTALVLILNSPGAYRIPIGPLSGQAFFETVITYVAVVSAMSSVSTLAFLEIAGGLTATYTFLDRFGTTLFLASVFGFMGILPFVLLPFSRVGSAVVLLADAFLLATYFVGRRLPSSPPRPG